MQFDTMASGAYHSANACARRRVVDKVAMKGLSGHPIDSEPAVGASRYGDPHSSLEFRVVAAGQPDSAGRVKAGWHHGRELVPRGRAFFDLADDGERKEHTCWTCTSCATTRTGCGTDTG